MAREDHARILLAAVLPNRKDRLSRALSQSLEEDHFRDTTTRNLWKILVRYFDMTGDVIPLRTMSDLLSRSGQDAAKALAYEALYEELAERTVEDHSFIYSIEALKDERAESLTGEAITTSLEILQRGVEIDRVEYVGHQAAREYLYAELGRIDRLASVEAAPEGDVRIESDAILQDYADRKAGIGVGAVQSGIATIDAVTSGFQNGELILVCAYTGEGKSQMSTQVAWDAMVRQGKNVFFATSETVREQVRRRLLARHSLLEGFEHPGGLDSARIKNGTLDENEEEVLRRVVEDFATNPTYGRMHVAQVPRGATLGYVEAKLARAQQRWNVDLVVVDYLALLKPDRRRQNNREELNDILKDAKAMAVSHDGGRGVPLVSPWQMSQSAYKDALRSGEYTLANLADTSEAEKSSDTIISLLRMPDTPGEVKAQMLKVRDSDRPAPFTLEIDYRCTYLGTREDRSVSAILSEDSSSEPWSGESLDDLLA